MDKEMKAALEVDGEKLRQMTGEDHGPWEVTMADPKANVMQGYHRFTAHDAPGESFGSFEVFWHYAEDPEDKDVEPGWYWWACFPGCMSDGEPCGPFATSQEAYDNAQEGA